MFPIDSFFFLFLFGDGKCVGERDRETLVCEREIGDQTQMCPDQESIPQHFGVQDDNRATLARAGRDDDSYSGWTIL